MWGTRPKKVLHWPAGFWHLAKYFSELFLFFRIFPEKIMGSRISRSRFFPTMAKTCFLKIPPKINAFSEEKNRQRQYSINLRFKFYLTQIRHLRDIFCIPYKTWFERVILFNNRHSGFSQSARFVSDFRISSCIFK